MSKTVRSTLTATANLNQINAFQLNSPSPRGTSDSVSIAISESFTFDVDEGIGVHLKLELSAAADSVLIDILDGTYGINAITDPFGNALYLDVVNLVALKSDGPVNLITDVADGWTNFSGDVRAIDNLVISNAEGWATEVGNQAFEIEAVTTPTGDDVITVELILVGSLVESSSV
jgi:hypothetical protein